MTPQTIALWLGIAGSAAGVYFPVKSHLEADRKAELQRVLDRVKYQDAVNQRFVADEQLIALIASQMPKDKREVLDAIRKTQQQAQMPALPEMMSEKHMNIQGLDSVSVSADAPAVKGEDNGNKPKY